MNNIEDVVSQELLIKELRDELDLKNKCLSLIAHDFKGVFSNIIWILDAYENKVITEQEFESMLPEIKQNAKINLNTINDTFTWIGSQREGEEPMQEYVNIHNMVSELEASMQKLIIDKNVSISKSGDSSIAYKCNPIFLRFILKKLIDNAIKYSYPKGEIEVEIKRINSNIHIFVKDIGTGIDEAKLPTLFTMNKASYLGTQGEKGVGLSLVIVKDFVKSMDGEIKIYPNEGDKGTIAELKFPLT